MQTNLATMHGATYMHIMKAVEVLELESFTGAVQDLKRVDRNGKVLAV